MTKRYVHALLLTTRHAWIYMLTHAPPQVWYIPQTGEVFITYEDYLNRYDLLAPG